MKETAKRRTNRDSLPSTLKKVGVGGKFVNIQSHGGEKKIPKETQNWLSSPHMI
jgi:hypothetical protein